MRKIGIVGSGAAESARQLKSLCGEDDLAVFVDSEAAKNIANLSALLVLSLSGQEWEEHLADRLPKDAALILNADEIRQFPYPLRPGLRLVTCGINPKASVTASSMQTEGGKQYVQCCIQRNLTTPSGVLEPQEFGVEAPAATASVAALLATVAASLLC